MDEGKKMLGIFLLVIIFIVGLGLFISKQRSEKAGTPTAGGSLESVLFPNRPIPTEKLLGQGDATSSTTSSKGGLGSILTKSKNSKVTPKVAQPSTAPKNAKTAAKATVTTKPGKVAPTTNVVAKTESAPKDSDRYEDPYAILYESNNEYDNGADSGSGTDSGNGAASGNNASITYANTIPETGVPIAFWSIALSSLLSGAFLKKKSA